jgi:DNA polymerase III delta prime subunit
MDITKQCVGHERILTLFKKLFQERRMEHAYIFSGPRHVGKHMVADILLDCLPFKEVIRVEHIVSEDGTRVDTIGIDQMRDVNHSLSLSLPDEKWYRIIYIDDAETITREAGNALLKSLEDPPSRTVFIFFEHMPGRILSTIRSRCCTVRFSLVRNAHMRAISTHDAIMRISAGRPGVAHALLKDGTLELLEKRIMLMREYGNMKLFSSEYARMTFQKEDGDVAEIALHQELQKQHANPTSYGALLARYDAYMNIRVFNNAHVYQPGLMEAFL